MSGPLERASATPDGLSSRERTLFHAYTHFAPTMVMQDCACGGVIRAVMGDWGAIAEAIRCHQEMTIHAMWREAVGL